MNVPTLNQLIRVLQQVPYLASKNVYKVAHHFLNMNDEQLAYFCQLLLRAKENVIPCSICFAWQERETSCTWCTSSKRDQSLVCVVESWQDLLAIEKTEGYKGLYHVLGGVVCPLEGIGPEELTIEPLIQRVSSYPSIKEVIIALSQTAEGEATATYIARQLVSLDIKVTALAQGMPVGSSLEGSDRLTVYRAISDRRVL
jgi:recombination protein RecR